MIPFLNLEICLRDALILQQVMKDLSEEQIAKILNSNLTIPLDKNEVLRRKEILEGKLKGIVEHTQKLEKL